jgi:predicted RNA-binding protein with TRAM domain
MFPELKVNKEMVIEMEETDTINHTNNRPALGAEHEVEIEGIGAQGDGICKVKGFVIIVPSTTKGEKVRIRITKIFRKIAFAEVID